MFVPPRAAALRPFVALIWASDEAGDGARERLLPTGQASVVFRISGPPVRVFDGLADLHGHTLGHAVVSGPTASPRIRDASAVGRTVGAQLLPGATEVLFAAPADALADRQIPLADLWGRAAERARERIAEHAEPARQIAAFEAVLAARLTPDARAIHPSVAYALAALGSSGSGDIASIVRETGYSHRHLIAQFRSATGLTPKRFARVLRFQATLSQLARPRPGMSLARLAADAGYADQAHLHRELVELAGVSPTAYRQLATATNHVKIIQDAAAPGRHG